MTIDMSIEAKSNQLNADDLMAGPRVIKVARVSANPSGPEQPVAVNFEGDGGKPYYPCKSMRRVMVQVWGVDAATYVGKSMKLVRDPDVMFGGLKVGGIRISEMSGLDGDKTLALTATRGAKKAYTVRPLKAQAATPAAAVDDETRADAEGFVSGFIAALANRATMEAVAKLQNSRKAALADLAEAFPDLAAQATDAIAARLTAIEAEAEAA